MENVNCDKVSQALTTLKMELMSIREQDVDLMKQLLKINDTIKLMSPTKNVRATNKSSNCKQVVTTSRRQNYLNQYLTNRRGSCASSNGSLSSVDELTSSVDDCEFGTQTDETTGSEENLTTTTHYFPVQYEKSNLARSISDEHLLISNIKVWKYKQSRSLEELQHINNQLSVS